MIYVTHDQVEAMTLADRIAIMRDGKIQQLASPSEIYNKPTNKFVADFIGSPSMNFMEGTLDNGQFRVGDISFEVSGYPFEAAASGGAVMGVRPEHIAAGSAAQSMPVQGEVDVDIVEPMGSDTLVWANYAGKPFRIRVDGQMAVKTGEKLPIGFDPATSSFFDAATEERL